MKRVFRILLSLFAMLVVALLLVVLLLGTQPGLQLTTAIINSLASTEDREIEISDLGGILGGSPRVGSVTIADGKGVWLEADGIAADISLRKLIRGEVDVSRLNVESLALARLPEAAPQTEEPSEGGGASLPGIPIRVDNVLLSSIELGEPVLGEAATLQLSASALLQAEPVDLSGTMDLKRIDGTQGEVSAEWTVAPELSELGLKLDASEPADGLLARALDIYGLPAIAIKLDGSGPLEDWKAALTVDLDNERTVEGNVALSLKEDHQSIEGQLKGFLTPLLPRQVAPLFAGDTNVDLSVERDGENTFKIHALDVRSALLSITASGGVLADAGTVDIEADIAFGTEGSVVEFDLNEETRLTIGHTQVHSSLKGSLEKADWELSGSVVSLAQGPQSISDIRLSGESTNVDFLERSGAAMIELDAASVVIGQEEADRLLGGNVRLVLDGSFVKTALDIKQAALKTDAVDLEASGQANLAENEYNIVLDGSVAPPDQDIVNAIFGSETAKISGRIVQQVAGTILLSDLVVTSGNLEVKGGAELSEGTVEANTQLSLSSLSALREEVKGGIKAEIRVDGELARPSIDIEAQGVDISILDKPLEDFSVRANAVADPENLQAELDIDGRYENQPVSVKASVSGGPGGAPVVDSLDVNVPGANANGRLVADDAGILTGELALDITSLADLGQLFLQQDLAGSLSGSIVFSDNDSAQAISATLAAPNVEASGVQANGLALKADVDDVRTLQGLVASATAESVVASGTTVENLDAEVSGSLEKLPFSVTATVFEEPASVSGEFSSMDGTMTVALDNAEATFKSIPLQLVEPVTVTVAESVTKVETATLKVGSGTVTAIGTAGEELDFDVSIAAIPLGLVDNVVSTGMDQRGTLSGNATIRGAPADPSVDFELELADLSVDPGTGSRTPELAVQSTGQFVSGVLTTQTVATGTGADVNISGTVDTNDDLALDMDVEIGSFDLALVKDFVPPVFAPQGKLSGTAKVTGAATDPSVDYDLALAEVSVDTGTGKPTPELTVNSSGQFASRVLTADLDASGTGTDLAVKATVDTNSDAQNALDVDVEIKSFALAVLQDFIPGDYAPTGALSGTASVSGAFDDPSVDFDVTLTDASVATGTGNRTPDLTVNSTGQFASQVLTTELTASGTDTDVSMKGKVDLNEGTDNALDVDVAVNSFAVVLVNEFVPTQFEPKGALSGKATVSGALNDPNVDYDLDLAKFSVATGQGKRTPELRVRTNGKLASRVLTTELDATGTGTELTVSGTVDINEGVSDALDLQVKINSFAIPLLESVVSTGLGLDGTLTGNSAISGSLSEPDVTYDMNVANFSVEVSRDTRMPTLTITSRGDLKSGKLTTRTTAKGTGIDFLVDGTVGLADSIPLDLKVQGNVPLELASVQLASSGLLVEGNTRISMLVSGTASSPLINGEVTASGVNIVDTVTSLTIRDIGVAIAFDGKQASINRLQGRLGTSGTISVGGTIGLDPASGLPANLKIAIKDGSFVTDILTAETSGQLTVVGPVLTSGKVAGTITLARADINIPDQLPSNIPLVDVVHRNAPGQVISQAQELAPASEQSNGNENASKGLSLDILVDAPRRIFLRGRGIDAELGGSVNISGTTRDPRMVGSFSMIRGRIDVLIKRFNFDRGTVTFDGTLDPVLDFQTTTKSGSNSYSIVVTGTASDPDISFTSSPTLPEDEILAQIFFGRSLSKLSALQIAQLAGAVAQLSGADTSGGVLGRLRSLGGLADIDVNTDSEGQTSVGVGAYINDRTYVNVEQGLGGGSGRVTIDLELTDNLKVRGEADSDGDTKAGFYYERDY